VEKRSESLIGRPGTGKIIGDEQLCAAVGIGMGPVWFLSQEQND